MTVHERRQQQRAAERDFAGLFDPAAPLDRVDGDDSTVTDGDVDA